jgi:transposase
MSWGGAGTGFTLLLEALILELAQHMPVRKIADLISEHDTKVWRVIKKHIQNARNIEDFSGVSKIGVDETSSKKGHNYISILVDADASKVLYATEGKDSKTVEKFREDLYEHQGNPLSISDFSCDMSPAFIKGINENFKWSNITYDKFHVIKNDK